MSEEIKPKARKLTPIIFSPEHVVKIVNGMKTQTRRAIVPQPPTVESVRERAGTGYNWMQCVDWNRPDTFRPVGPIWAVREVMKVQGNDLEIVSPYAPGAALWVREPWRTLERPSDNRDGILFKADGAFVSIQNSKEAADLWMEAHNNGKYKSEWRNAMYMPRWASRLRLKITAVRVERVQEISEADVEAEGVKRYRRESGQEEGFPEGWEDVRPDWGGAVWKPKAFKEAYRVLWDSINEKRQDGIFAWEKNPWVWAITFEVERIKRS